MVRVPKTRASFGSKDGAKEWLVGFALKSEVISHDPSG